jgi:hypothetical protein
VENNLKTNWNVATSGECIGKASTKIKQKINSGKVSLYTFLLLLLIALHNIKGVMLHIIPLSSFYPPKIDMTLEITIEFMIDHYWILIQW